MVIGAIAVALRLAPACSTGSLGPPPAPPIDWDAFRAHRTVDAGRSGPTVEERATGQAYAAAVASAGCAQLAPLLDSDARLTFPGMGDVRGREAVVAAHLALFGAFAGRAMRPTRVLSTDGAQALEWTLRGTQDGAFMGTAATHQPVAFRGLTVLATRDDGRIAEVHIYFDLAEIKAQLGAGPPGVAANPAPDVTGPPQIIEQTGSADEARDVGAARAWLDALEQGDEAAYLSALTDDVTLTAPERATPLRGRGALTATFRDLRRSIGELDTEALEAWAAGRFVVIEYSISGEQLGPIDWVPAQRDAVVRLHVADVLEARDGAFARITRYENPAEILGRAPEPVVTAGSRDP